MRLGIDGRRLVGPRTGVGRYLERLLWHWGRNNVPFEEIVCYTPGLPDDAEELTRGPIRFASRPTALPGLAWENLQLRRAAAESDLFFGASYSLPLWCPGASVVSNLGIYASQPGTFPWWHRWRYGSVYRHSARRADLVIANSRSTRDDIAAYYGVDPDRIEVVYPGVDEVFGPVEDREELARRTREILGFGGPYFLMVGKLSVRRHVPELFEAMRRFQERTGRDDKLVVVGPNHLDLPVEEYIRRAGVEDRVVRIEHLPQSDLRHLYAGATAYVLLTTHEGFSFTILEALACGAPVITVDHRPLREGIVDHVVALPDADPAGVAGAMERMATDPDHRRTYRRESLACAERFSWKKAADDTMRLLARVAGA